MKKIKHIPLLGLFIISLSACEIQELTPFSAEPAVNFMAKTVEYSFLTNPENEYVQEIDVEIMGNPTENERTFNVEVVQDSLTTASEYQYEIIGGTIKPGEFKGALSVKLFKSAQLDTATVSIHLRIIDSPDFRKGNSETINVTVKWTNQVIVPSWTYFRFFFTATASTAAYRAIVESTGITSFLVADYRAVGEAGAIALGTQFGDYVKQWNKDNPDNHLKHDDGATAGQDIIPLYYTRSKFD